MAELLREKMIDSDLPMAEALLAEQARRLNATITTTYQASFVGEPWRYHVSAGWASGSGQLDPYLTEEAGGTRLSETYRALHAKLRNLPTPAYRAA